MKSIGIEEFALVLSGIGVISSVENSIEFGSSWSSCNFVIYARIVISEGESSTEPCPLKSPFSIRQVKWDVNRSRASSGTSISWFRISSIRVLAIVGKASSDLVAYNFLNTVIEIGMNIRS